MDEKKRTKVTITWPEFKTVEDDEKFFLTIAKQIKANLSVLEAETKKTTLLDVGFDYTDEINHATRVCIETYRLSERMSSTTGLALYDLVFYVVLFLHFLDRETRLTIEETKTQGVSPAEFIESLEDQVIGWNHRPFPYTHYTFANRMLAIYRSTPIGAIPVNAMKLGARIYEWLAFVSDLKSRFILLTSRIELSDLERFYKWIGAIAASIDQGSLMMTDYQLFLLQLYSPLGVLEITIQSEGHGAEKQPFFKIFDTALQSSTNNQKKRQKLQEDVFATLRDKILDVIMDRAHPFHQYLLYQCFAFHMSNYFRINFNSLYLILQCDLQRDPKDLESATAAENPILYHRPRIVCINETVWVSCAKPRDRNVVIHRNNVDTIKRRLTWSRADNFVHAVMLWCFYMHKYFASILEGGEQIHDVLNKFIS